MTPHMKRWLTGVLAVPLLFSLIYFGSKEIFLLLVILLTVAGAAEYGAMAFQKKLSWETITGFAAAFFIPVAAYFGGLQLILSVVTVFFMSALLIFLGSLKEAPFSMSPVNKVAFGILYVPLLMAHLVLIRAFSDGVFWIFFMIVIAFTGDITAFYVGRKFGKRKLLPNVSGGKTVAGTVGSVVGSVAGCMIFKTFLFPEIAMGHAVVMGFVGNIIGELGDLCESAIKRSAGIKDSGFLFPGHGGVLDRLDCILFIAPFLYYYRLYVIG
jgi:phosphatidate cytidylyltransferase